jgi:hypothetical protein
MFREAFIKNQRENEGEWVIDSDGNIDGGDPFNRGFVAKKYEQMRVLLEQQGIQAAETHIFNNPWGMKRAAVYIPTIMIDGQDIRNLTEMLSIHTGLQVGIIRVKFCNQCGRTIMASNGNGNMCPACRENARLLNEPFTKETEEDMKLVTKGFGNEGPTDINDDLGSYDEGQLVKEFLEDDDHNVTPEDMQPNMKTTLGELLEGDNIEATEEDWGERAVLENAPPPQLSLPRNRDRTHISDEEPRQPVTIETDLEPPESEGLDETKRENRMLEPPMVAETNHVIPELESDAPTEKTDEIAVRISSLPTKVSTLPEEIVKEKVDSQGADLITEEVESGPEAAPLDEEENESSWMPKIMSATEQVETNAEQEKAPVDVGKRVVVVKGPFKELFGEKPAVIKLVNKKKGTATLSQDDGGPTVVVPIEFLKEVGEQ